MENADDFTGEAHFNVVGVLLTGCHLLAEGINLRLRPAQDELVVQRHGFVRHAHDLAVHLLWCGKQRDVVALAFAHLQAAVGARQRFAHNHGNLRLLAQALLQFAPRHQDVEQLILAAHLYVRFLGDGIVGLHQRVEELVQVDGLPGINALAEILAHKELLHGEVAGQPDNVRKVQW